jgi:hypothetical protein
MSNYPLLDYADRERATVPQILQEEQQENLKRVKDRLSAHVKAFCEQIGTGGRFYAEDLRRSVAEKFKGAPDSGPRILRLLRQEGQLDYSIVNRRQSLYQIEAIK